MHARCVLGLLTLLFVLQDHKSVNSAPCSGLDPLSLVNINMRLPHRVVQCLAGGSQGYLIETAFLVDSRLCSVFLTLDSFVKVLRDSG